MDRMVSARSSIKLFLVIALSLALSCVTAPGIRTSDVAELHYGDREEAVVEKLGEGSEILYFKLDEKQYRYRLYTTKYIHDVYALLFLNGTLVAVNDKKYDFSECLVIDDMPAWNQCLSNLLSKMRFNIVDLDNYEFTHGVKAEQEEQSERNRSRVGATAIAVPLTVVLPGIVPMYCFISCGQGCKDPGARPGDYRDRCIDKLKYTLNQAITILQGDITPEAIDNLLGQIQHKSDVHSRAGAGADKNIEDNTIIYYSWSCKHSQSYLSTKLGLTNGQLKWAWFRFVSSDEAERARKFSKCSGTWDEIKKCVNEED